LLVIDITKLTDLFILFFRKAIKDGKCVVDFKYWIPGLVLGIIGFLFILIFTFTCCCERCIGGSSSGGGYSGGGGGRGGGGGF